MKKNILAQSVFLVVFMLQLNISNAQMADNVNSIANTHQEQVNELFEAWNTNTTPGAAIAIIKDGAIAYAKAYGNANLEFNTKNTPSTLFNIASNSKQFTTYAILQLEEEGKLSLEDDIRKHLPEIPDFGETITIKNLAQHTHGIRGITYLLGTAGWHIEDVITRKAVLKLLSQQKELNFVPGTDFSYNNSGYMLLAEIVERTSGKPFDVYLSENIFTPLHMTNTVLLNDYEKVIPNLSSPYYYDGQLYKKGIRNSKDIVGNTGIRTSIQDLTKWIINFEDKKIGNEMIFDKLKEPGILKNGDTLGYSLGLIKSTYKRRQVISHGGADAGYRSQILRFPNERLSVAVLANDGSLNADEKAYKIADIYLGENTTLETSSDTINTIGKPSVSKEILKRYEGKYELQPGFILEFQEKEGQLYITATGQGTLPLETLNELEYKIRRIGAIITFVKNGQGNFDSLTFNHDGKIIKGAKIKYEMSFTDLSRYTGIYYSPELKTSYEVKIEGGNLIASHQRQETTILTPLNKQEFSGNTWFFGNLDFVFSEGIVQGFKVSSERVEDLWFEKIKE